MKLYNCKVRLAGSIDNEVRKEGASAAEVILLRKVHGDDAVVNIVEAGQDNKLTHEGMRDQLRRDYGEKLVDKTFDPMLDLPVKLSAAALKRAESAELEAITG